jgi:hypothetical protein
MRESTFSTLQGAAPARHETMSEEASKEEILINVTPSEVRAALLENGIVKEVHIERASRRGVISNIYKGRVTRVLPGMQAAFVEVGLARTAFLHVSDIFRPQNGDDGEHEVPDIRELVHEGAELLVQVVKDPLGNKGARLTTFVTLPARHRETGSAFRPGSMTRRSASGCEASSPGYWRNTGLAAARSFAPLPRAATQSH